MKDRFKTFTGLIAKISRNIKKIKNQEMAEYGLRSVHVTCLYYLSAEDNLTATDLCARCEEDKATISRALDYLEDNGFIACDSKLAKKYKSTLHLTEKGRAVGEKIAVKINFVLDEICIDLTEAQREDFYRSLTIVSDSLELCTQGIQSAKRVKANEASNTGDGGENK